jgi:hypothetical protein
VPILSALLEAFPQHTIAFRPYPAHVDIEIARALSGQFMQIERFVFDESGTGVALQKRAALVVTDSSSSALTFSISSGRPLVFAQLAEDASSAAADPQSTPLGFRVRSRAGLIAAVRHGCEHPGDWRKQISQAREEYLYNPGRASKYLAEHLPLLAVRGSHPEWLSVERRPWLGVDDAHETSLYLSRLHAWSTVPGTHVLAMQNEIQKYLNERRENVRCAAAAHR